MRQAKTLPTATNTNGRPSDLIEASSTMDGALAVEPKAERAIFVKILPNGALPARVPALAPIGIVSATWVLGEALAAIAARLCGLLGLAPSVA